MIAFIQNVHKPIETESRSAVPGAGGGDEGKWDISIGFPFG